MSKNTKTKRCIVAIATCISVAAPIVCLPVGTTENTSARLSVRRAYADTYPESQYEIASYDDFMSELQELYGEDLITYTGNEEELPPEDIPTDVDVPPEGFYGEIEFDPDGNPIDPVTGEIITYPEPGETPEDGDTVVAQPTTEYDDVSTFMVAQDYDEADLPIELLDPQFFEPDETTYYIAARSSILKEQPDMSSMTVTTLNYGQEIVRIGIGDTWSKIRTEYGNEGYVLTSTLSYEMIFEAIDRIVWVDTGSLSLRAEPSTQAELIATLPDETRLHCTRAADKWFYVITPNGQEGYVYRSYTTQTPPPTPTPSPTPRPANNGGGGGGGGSNSGGGGGGGGSTFTNYGACAATVVSACQSMLGKPYVWGACSSSAVDCSGLVCYAYGLCGYSLPHYSVSLMSVGYGVSRDNIQPGDIVCWDTGGGYCGHVGIYVGGGQVIHAAGVRWGVVYGSVDMHPILAIRRIF